MPTYEYRCDACKHTFEELQSFSEEPLKKCPEGGKKNPRFTKGGKGGGGGGGGGFDAVSGLIASASAGRPADPQETARVTADLSQRLAGTWEGTDPNPPPG